MKSRRWSYWGFAVILGLFLALVYHPPFQVAHPAFHLGEWTERFQDVGSRAPVLFVTAAAAAVILGVPRLLLATLGGALFGWWWGLCLSQVGTLLGCWLTFLGGRILGPAYLMRKVGGRIPLARNLFGWIRRREVTANILIRMFPVGSCLATNLLMSVTSMRHRTFLIGTFLGTLPLTVAGVLFGSASGEVARFQILGGALLLAMMGLAQKVGRRGAQSNFEAEPEDGRVETSSGPAGLARNGSPALRAS